MYIVEKFEKNEWMRVSTHKDSTYAHIVYEVNEKAGRKCRIIHEGKIIRGDLIRRGHTKEEIPF